MSIFYAIMTEIKIANETNNSIKKSSIILTVLQFIIVLFSIFVALSSFISVSSNINSMGLTIGDQVTKSVKETLDKTIEKIIKEEIQKLKIY